MSVTPRSARPRIPWAVVVGNAITLSVVMVLVLRGHVMPAVVAGIAALVSLGMALARPWVLRGHRS